MNVLPVPHLGSSTRRSFGVVSLYEGYQAYRAPLLGHLLQLKPASALQFRRFPKAEVSRKGYTGRHAIS
jgi:hypothetical protein